MNGYLNRSINPCDSFYDFACNGWENNHLLDYLLQMLSNGGSEYDNFVKARVRIEDNLDRMLTTDINQHQQSSPISSLYPSLSAAVAENQQQRGEDVESHNKLINNNIQQHQQQQLTIQPYLNAKLMYGQCLSMGKQQHANLDALHFILGDIGGWPLLTKQFKPETYQWEHYFPIILNHYKDNVFIELDTIIDDEAIKHLLVNN